MAVALPQPVLPWSGAQEEDRRFRRILLTVLVAASILSAILRQLPLPWIEPELEIEEAASVVRILAQPIPLYAPAQEPETGPVAAEEASAGVLPTPQAAGVETPVIAPVETPVEPRAVTPEPEIQPAVTAEPEIQPAQPQREAPPPDVARITTPQPERRVEAEPPRRVDREAAARDKAASSGVLAMRDSLAALRAFTPAAPAAGTAPGPARANRPQGGGKTSVLNQGVASGSGGIGSAVPGPRDILGGRGLQDGFGGAGGLAVLGSASGTGGVGGSRAVRGKTRSEEEIQAVLDRHKSAIYALYNRELRKDPSLQGKVVVSITIAPSGKVTDCRIEYSELGSEPLKQDLVRLIKGVDFGAKADVPPVTTKVPIEFFPV